MTAAGPGPGADPGPAVQAYLARLARRWAPLVSGLVVAGGLAAAIAASGGGGATTAAGGAGANPGPSPAATSGAAPGSAPGAATGPGPAPGSGPGASGPAPVAEGITPPPAAGSTGTTRSGVACGPGVRQVAFSAYAPPCIPTYHGNNGGSTSYGVTADTVTLDFRRTNSAEEKAAFAAAGAAAPGTDDQYLSDLRAYVGLFNRTYELYGRHVVVKDFNGQGDNLQEDEGQDLAGAQADAVTAHDLGSFMDVSQSPTLASTEPYEEDLAQEHVVAVGGLGLPLNWYRQYSPYELSVSPNGTKGAVGAGAALCQKAAGMPAVFAGEADYQVRNRTFGLVLPNTPWYNQIGDTIQSTLKQRCNTTIVKRISYDINVSTFESESANAMAQMRVAGVTTVICGCDPIVTIFLSNAAEQQQYHPEWFAIGWGDPDGRLMNSDQWAHAISEEGTAPPAHQSEAYRAFKLADPSGEPAEKYYAVAYYTALYVFDGLQLAGPDLTPQSLQRGYFSMPASALGDVGVWSGGPDAFDPQTDSQIGYWDPNAVSNFDGQKGAWLSCEGGRWFAWSDPSALGPHTQLHCFGR